jgi:hypothetical protein
LPGAPHQQRGVHPPAQQAAQASTLARHVPPMPAVLCIISITDLQTWLYSATGTCWPCLGSSGTCRGSGQRLSGAAPVRGGGGSRKGQGRHPPGVRLPGRRPPAQAG